MNEEIQSLRSETESLRRRTASLESNPNVQTTSADGEQIKGSSVLPQQPESPAQQSGRRLSEATAQTAPVPPPFVEPKTGPIIVPPPGSAPLPRMERPPADHESSLAEKLGTMGFVWIGATALALAGIFLVKYSFEHGWISPAIRILLAVLFGGSLLVAAEWMRTRSSRISEGLSAAAIADLYASFLAAYHLYHLIPAFVAFGLMGLITVAAVLLSLRQGQFVAVLGLMGGFLTPSWIRTGRPDASSLFSYLMLLQIGLLLISHKKRWNILMVLTFCGSMIWLALWLTVFYQRTDSLTLSLFLVITVALFVWRNYSEDQAKNLQPLNYLSMFAGAAMMTTLTGFSGYQTPEWIFLAMLSVASLVLAARQRRYFGLACGTLLCTSILLLIWSFSTELAQIRFRITIFSEILLFAGSSYFLIWKSKEDSRWATFSATAALALFLIGYFAEPADTRFHWSIISILLAGFYFAGAYRVRQKPEGLQSPNPTLAALAVAVTAFVSLTIPLEFHERSMIVPFALEIVALTAISRRLKISVLDLLASILCLVVMALLLLRLGAHPSWRWILYSYGISGVSLAAASYFTIRKDRSDFYQWCAVFIFLLMIALESGQIHHPGSFWIARSWLEAGTIAIGWLGFALLLLRVGVKWNPRISVRAARGIAFLAVAELFLFGGLILNPLFFKFEVGQLPILNYLLYVYGAPAVLLLLLSQSARWNRTNTALFLRALSLILLFLLMNFEIRQYFHGTFLTSGSVSTTEQYIYSVAWVMFGIVLTVIAVASRGLMLRYASLAVLLMAVCKVFIYDSGNLTDLYRVFSFLGLGMSLLGIAYLYQKVLFRLPQDP